MSTGDQTCWTLIHDAANGSTAARGTLARVYGPVCARYLRSRWRSPRLRQEIDDAVQEILVECYKEQGVLAKASPESGSFRRLLQTVAKHVALRFERRAAQSHARRPDDTVEMEDVEQDETTLSAAFDQSWAKSLMTEAHALHGRRAAAGDADSQRRLELLKLRVGDGLAIAEIAKRWGESNVPSLHRAFKRAREEFRLCLREVVRTHTAAPEERLEEECRRLITLL